MASDFSSKHNSTRTSFDEEHSLAVINKDDSKLEEIWKNNKRLLDDIKLPPISLFHRILHEKWRDLLIEAISR